MPTSECAALLKTGTTRLQDEDKVAFLEWNVENVMDLVGKHELTGVNPETGAYHYTPAQGQPRQMDAWKFGAKQNKIATAGQYTGLGQGVLPHFFVGAEIEDLRVAKELLTTGPLKDAYNVWLKDGNDERGIDLAFACRADLDVTVEMETHVNTMWYDEATGTWVRLFSRDLPVWLIRDRASGELLQIIMAAHNKSQRPRPGDPNSSLLSSAQHAAIKLIKEDYVRRFGPDVPIALMGDLNRNIPSAPEAEPVRESFEDMFDIIPPPSRVTQTFYPNNHVVVKSQLNGILVSPNMRPFVRGAYVLPEFDHVTGAPLPQAPKTFKERTENYASDHRATVLIVDGQIYRRRTARH